MNRDDAKRWWERWGPWVGPSSVMILLAMLTRMDSCNATPWTAAAKMEAIEKRVDALAGRVDDQAAWRVEHQRVTESRTQQLDNHERDLAVLKESNTMMRQDISDIKDTLEYIRRNMQTRGPGVKPGTWRGATGG